MKQKKKKLPFFVFGWVKAVAIHQRDSPLAALSLDSSVISSVTCPTLGQLHRLRFPTSLCLTKSFIESHTFCANIYIDFLCFFFFLFIFCFCHHQRKSSLSQFLYEAKTRLSINSLADEQIESLTSNNETFTVFNLRFLIDRCRAQINMTSVKFDELISMMASCIVKHLSLMANRALRALSIFAMFSSYFLIHLSLLSPLFVFKVIVWFEVYFC